MSNGKLTKVTIYDSKAVISDYIRGLGLERLPHTFFHAGMYYNNIEHVCKQEVEPGSGYTVSFPYPSSTRVPLFDPARDTGKFVAAILVHREKVLGRDIYGATAYYTLDKVLQVVQAKNPSKYKKLEYVEQSEEVFRAATGLNFGREPHGDLISAIYEMQRWVADFGNFGGEDPEGQLQKGLEVLELAGQEDGVLKLTTLDEYVSWSEKL